MWTHGVGGALQRPREQSELPSEAFLIKAFGVRGQQVQVLAERTECVFTTAVDHMAIRRLHRRHVLREEVVFHLQHTGSDFIMTLCRRLFSGVCRVRVYPQDPSVVRARRSRVMEVTVVDGILQCLCTTAVISSSAEDPLRR